jgi:hypothetical protein
VDLTCGAANMPMPTWRQLVLSLYMSKFLVQVGKEARLHIWQHAQYPLIGRAEGSTSAWLQTSPFEASTMTTGHLCLRLAHHARHLLSQMTCKLTRQSSHHVVRCISPWLHADQESAVNVTDRTYHQAMNPGCPHTLHELVDCRALIEVSHRAMLEIVGW